MFLCLLLFGSHSRLVPKTRHRYEPGRRELDQCRYNQNEGYVVFSAMGSFFIPMTVMVYVYVRISCVVASRHDKMTEIEVHKVRVARSCEFPADAAVFASGLRITGPCSGKASHVDSC